MSSRRQPEQWLRAGSQLTIFVIICFKLLLSYAYKAHPKVCIIGAGVGGLVSSTMLSRRGLKTLVIEKNDRCGGRLGSEQLHSKDDPCSLYRFDIGPSLLLLPASYRSTYALLGEDINDHLDLLHVDPYYRCFFADEQTSYLDIGKHSDYESFAEGSANQINDYLQTSKSFLDFGLPNVIEEKFTTTKLLPFIVACIKAFPLLPHNNMLERYFSSPKVRAAMSFQNLYVGLSPYNAPAIFSLLQALEFDQGIFYPRGGFQTVTDSLVDIARKNDVDIRTNHRLRSYHHAADSQRVEHVMVRDTLENKDLNITADVFISNIDVPSNEYYLYQDPSSMTQSAASTRNVPSCGVLQFHFAFDVTLATLKHHNIFFSSMDEQRRSWLLIEQPDKLYAFDLDNFNFYVHAPSRTDPSVCPAGHDAITVLVPVSPLLNHQEDKINANNTFCKSVRDRVLQRIEKAMDASQLSSPIESHLVAEMMRTAYDWRDEFDLYRGAAFGLRHSLDQLAMFRPRFRHPRLGNLYRIGASTRPGNGVPLVMIGARLAAEIVLRDLQAKT
jgi:phytoene desaturase (3,4-didehydrolycopene-forming)